VYVCGQNGDTPLFAAVRGSHDICVRALLGAGANVNLSTLVRLRTSLCHPFPSAVSLGCSDVDHAQPCSTAMQDGATPLYDACERGDNPIVKALLSAAGIDVNRARQVLCCDLVLQHAWRGTSSFPPCVTCASLAFAGRTHSFARRCAR
jgi:ankyrin repeat protein